MNQPEPLIVSYLKWMGDFQNSSWSVLLRRAQFDVRFILLQARPLIKWQSRQSCCEIKPLRIKAHLRDANPIRWRVNDWCATLGIAVAATKSTRKSVKIPIDYKTGRKITPTVRNGTNSMAARQILRTRKKLNPNGRPFSQSDLWFNRERNHFLRHRK